MRFSRRRNIAVSNSLRQNKSVSIVIVGVDDGVRNIPRSIPTVLKGRTLCVLAIQTKFKERWTHHYYALFFNTFEVNDMMQYILGNFKLLSRGSYNITRSIYTFSFYDCEILLQEKRFAWNQILSGKWYFYRMIVFTFKRGITTKQRFYAIRYHRK